MAELEMYSPGAEFDRSTGAGLAVRMGGIADLETAGVLDSKFGRITLLRQVGLADACLAFFMRSEDPAL